MMNYAQGSPAIVLDRLRVVRGGRVVLDDVSLEVARGSVTGLLGPSGCGKSTLMRSVVGVQVVAGGRLTVLGEPAGTAPLRRRVGYVTQAPSVYADLTVRENLRYFAAVLGAPRTDVDRVIGEVGLTSHADAVVGRLSGGQEARVSLAAALLGEPELLVLDEPTVGLDPVLRRDLWDLFRTLAERGTTLLVSSHVMDEATRCDRLLLMREGALLADDTEQGLLDRTGAADVEAAFLALVDGAAPDPARGTNQITTGSPS
ncbi:MAG: ABC transporter ATP-binding protein [Sporichthyaceae bacterium]